MTEEAANEIPASATPIAPTEPPPLVVGPAYELPTARQVVGRGLQLALDATGDVRRASLFTGLLLLAVAAPFLLLVVANLQQLGDALTIATTPGARQADLEPYLGLLVEAYAAGLLAAIGAVAVIVDGSLTVAALIGSRAVGRPLGLRESLQRARQVFWRYAAAVLIVGLINAIATAIIGRLVGADAATPSLGSSLLGSLVGALVAAPFGYIITGTVLGDVGAMTAVRRSVTLARARPALALVIAAFAFVAQAIQLFAISAAAEVVDDLVGAVHPSLDPASASGALAVLVIVALGIVAYGSLVVTVSAISVAPQVTAFLGLTHFSGGLERARVPIADPAGGSRTRWVTWPMLILIAVASLVVAAGIVGGPGG